MKKHPKTLKQFGGRIREVRNKQGFSQEAFADKCGMDRSYIGGIERGERNVSLLNIQTHCLALRISISELCKGVGA